jgi:hypothetical protein
MAKLTRAALPAAGTAWVVPTLAAYLALTSPFSSAEASEHQQLILLAAVVGIFPSAYVVRRFKRSRVELDWSVGTLDVRNPFRNLTIELDEVQSFFFQGTLGYDYVVLMLRSRAKVGVVAWPFSEAADELAAAGVRYRPQ